MRSMHTKHYAVLKTIGTILRFTRVGILSYSGTA